MEFYTSIMPELVKFQASKTGLDAPLFNSIPKCYTARHDLLIMGKYVYTLMLFEFELNYSFFFL